MQQLVLVERVLRPNMFVNTPDILHAYLQRGGRPAFEARLVLATTLSPTCGIYSGFERFENVPVREGSRSTSTRRNEASDGSSTASRSRS